MEEDTVQLKCYYFNAINGLLDMKFRKLVSAFILNNNNNNNNNNNILYSILQSTNL